MIKNLKHKILITGSKGVLGNSFRRNENIFNDYNIIYTSGRDCDLTDQKSCSDLFEKIKPDYVFHVAAKSGGIGLSSQYQASHLHDNLLMGLNIAQNCVKHKVKKTIFTLSVGMYPEKSPLPIKEESNLKGEPHHSNFGYAYAKSIIDPLIKTYREQYKINFIGLVPNGIFGPEDNFHPDHSPMLPSLIRKAYLAKQNNQKLDVWGDGTPLRQYTFADDYVRIFKWALDNYNEPEIINVGTSEEKSIFDIAKYICNSTGLSEDSINFLTDKPKGIFRRPMSNEKFLNLTDFKYTPLSNGIESTCNWFAENFKFIEVSNKG